MNRRVGLLWKCSTPDGKPATVGKCVEHYYLLHCKIVPFYTVRIMYSNNYSKYLYLYLPYVRVPVNVFIYFRTH